MCISGCVYVSVRVRMRACMRMRVYMHMHVRVGACAFARACAGMCVCVCGAKYRPYLLIQFHSKGYRANLQCSHVANAQIRCL